jgi:hypothetical protein
MRKIQIRELAMMEFCRFVVGVGCFLGGIKQAEVNFSVIYSQFRAPFFTYFVPPNSLKSTCIASFFWSIAPILGMAAFSKIVSAIIQSVSIPMVDLLSWESVHNQTVHSTVTVFGAGLGSVETFCIFIPIGPPIPLREPFKIFGINDCSLSSCERNQAVRLIERLDNFVSANTAFWHESSAKGFVLPAAILSQAVTY